MIGSPMRYSGLMLGLLVVLSAAACRQEVPSDEVRLTDDVVRVTGTVRFFGIEGGFWAVRGDDSTTYDPITPLSSEFQVEGLRVHLEAKLRPDLAGIHMAGPVVEVISIRRL